MLLTDPQCWEAFAIPADAMYLQLGIAVATLTMTTFIYIYRCRVRSRLMMYVLHATTFMWTTTGLSVMVVTLGITLDVPA